MSATVNGDALRIVDGDHIAGATLRPISLDRGHLVISLDVELAWGRIADADRARYSCQYAATREVVDRLLALMDELHVPATWAVVGALYDDDREERVDLQALHPTHSWGTLESAPELSGPGASLVRAPEIVEAIRDAFIQHEIGSHSYSHIVFDESVCSADRAATDIRLARGVAEEHGLDARSFVFPRNRIGHLDLLASYRFETFRAPDTTWYGRLPPLIRKLAEQVDLLFALTPAVSPPYITGGGLVFLPGSLPFWTYSTGRGLRRILPVRWLVAKAKRGLLRAASEHRVFHLWLHPFNFAHREASHFAGLEEVLRLAVELRDTGEIEISTMGALANLIRSEHG